MASFGALQGFQTRWSALCGLLLSRLCSIFYSPIV
jgi:hypothetical protein